MASTPESKVKAKIKAILKEHGVYYAMPIGTGYGNAGVPDFLCCIDGRFVAIEAKSGIGQTTALQEKNLRDIEAAGGITFVVREQTIEALRGYVKLLKEKK
jgi:hypothetical protein